MFRPLTSPALFPPFVAQHSVEFVVDDFDAGALASLPLPASLATAVAKRKVEFAAGRACGRESLRRLGARAADAPVAIAADRSPIWPDGFVGAITHTHGFACAAVAPRAQARGIGLDCALLMADDTARNVTASIARADELESLVAATGASRALVLTALFSAKEAIFKCLHRLVGRLFGFFAVELTSLSGLVGAGGGRFGARLTSTLTPELRAGTELGGRILLDGARVHTGVLLLAGDEGAPPRFA